jgi:hypothetical protein
MYGFKKKIRYKQLSFDISKGLIIQNFRFPLKSSETRFLSVDFVGATEKFMIEMLPFWRVNLFRRSDRVFFNVRGKLK